MILKFQRTDGMCNALHRIAQRMCEVIHRVDAPCITGAVMMSMRNPVQNRIAQVDVRRTHIDLGTQNPCSIREFSRTHTAEQIEILFHADAHGKDYSCPARSSVPRSSRICSACQIASTNAFPFLNQQLSAVIHFLEIIRGKAKLVPFKAKPAHILLNGFHILRIFFNRIRIVEAKVCPPSNSSASSKLRQMDLACPICK